MKKKEDKKKKQREENKKKQDEEKEDKEWKEEKKERIVKDGNEEDYEKSQISGMHKRSKTKDTIKPDLTVSMKAARIERQRVKMLKPQLLFEKKWAEKRQSAVEEIFKDVDVNNDVVYTEEYSSSEESLSSNSKEEEKASLNLNNNSQLKNYKRDMSWEMEIAYLLL